MLSPPDFPLKTGNNIYKGSILAWFEVASYAANLTTGLVNWGSITSGKAMKKVKSFLVNPCLPPFLHCSLPNSLAPSLPPLLPPCLPTLLSYSLSPSLPSFTIRCLPVSSVSLHLPYLPVPASRYPCLLLPPCLFPWPLPSYLIPCLLPCPLAHSLSASLPASFPVLYLLTPLFLA